MHWRAELQRGSDESISTVLLTDLATEAEVAEVTDAGWEELRTDAETVAATVGDLAEEGRHAGKERVHDPLLAARAGVAEIAETCVLLLRANTDTGLVAVIRVADRARN